MERMAAPLSAIIPILLGSNCTKSSPIKIPLGDVATSLFNCIHAMHTQNYLFQDVKPDNFMLSVANRIRLIDFGLVERYSEMASTSHREDAFPGAQLVGTPTYASLNVMGGHTPSRRDDLEALGYVLCELNVLPWSHAKSDKELYQIKQQEMDKSKRSKSALFTELKAAGGLDVLMGKYFNEVMDLEYAEKPDYDSLRGHLNKIVVGTTTSAAVGGKVGATAGAKKAAASPKKPPVAAASKKSPRRNPSRHKKEIERSSDSSVSSDENVENCKKQKVSSRTIATQTDDGMICLDDSSEEEGDDVQEMDWEVLNNGNDGNVAPVAAAAAAAGGSKSAFLKLEVISGSQKGLEVSFGGDYPDTVLVGREPSSSTAKALKDSAKLALTQDDSVSSIHAKFVISSKKNLHSVRVTDMSSSFNDETLVNGTRLAAGKSRQAFVGDKITVGRSILQVKRV
ncbi:hypothetical protein ACHAXM_000540 [Skeletonema potamos]